jgi:predicted NodU family carbamoyl transferase
VRHTDNVAAAKSDITKCLVVKSDIPVAAKSERAARTKKQEQPRADKPDTLNRILRDTCSNVQIVEVSSVYVGTNEQVVVKYKLNQILP